MSRVADLVQAGNADTIAWLQRDAEQSAKLRERYPEPNCNIMAVEQLYVRSAAEKKCYICGHRTTHRQTTNIMFPPQAQKAYICAECDAE